MTTTEDPYVRVEREDLAVGMRFDYRLPGGGWDGQTRTLTSLCPIEYDWDRGDHAARVNDITEDDLTDREFYVHRDDITLVPTLVPVEQARVGEPMALELPGSSEAEVRRRLSTHQRTWLRVDAHGRVEFEQHGNAGKTAGTYTHVWVLRPPRPEPAPAETAPEAASSVESTGGTPESPRERAAWQAGVVAGREEAEREHVKAQEERGDERATGMRHRPRFTREDAVVLAIQAVGGGEHAMSVVSMASSIEQYVNGDERPTYPHPDGETIVLGPGVFASEDRAVLNWDGVNYVQQIRFPDVIETAEQAALPWPDGTTVTDKDGDTWTRGDDSKATRTADRDGWLWGTNPHIALAGYLPATVTSLGDDA